ncbi:MAG: DegT/DnrJ/EryC1/StrS family aminotransferase [Polyangiaceae bacterium]|nr:DegT/DnrJ/EryC1/StrS family aminotransferase [Polyangiaceae bacterium]
MSGRLAIFGGEPALSRSAHRIWPILGDDARRATARVLDRGVLSGAAAPECVAFEREMAAFVSAKHALLTNSGTSALHLALVAAGVRAGDHVLVPAYSFVATALAVIHAGAIPIFVDVDETTGLLHADDAARALTPRTRAIMPVHVHGCAFDVGRFADLCEGRRIALVEDAAQAHGAMWRGRPVGALGRAGGFSLQSSKNLGAGEGGVFVTNDDAVAAEAFRLRSFGQPIDLDFDVERPLDAARPTASERVGWMYRGTELTAAIARAGLARLAERTEACCQNAALLSSALAELPGVTPPIVPEGATSVHHKFRVKLDPNAAGLDVAPRVLRDAMMHALAAEGLEVVLWQTAPLPAQPAFQSGGQGVFGSSWPWSTDAETDFAAAYDVASFPRTQRLLDGSIVLFSQSCPLIAQPRDVVERYAEIVGRVWRARGDVVAAAR